MEDNELTQDWENEPYTLTEKFGIIIGSIFSLTLWGLILYIPGKIIQEIIIYKTTYIVSFYLIIFLEIIYLSIFLGIGICWFHNTEKKKKKKKKLGILRILLKTIKINLILFLIPPLLLIFILLGFFNEFIIQKILTSNIQFSTVLLNQILFLFIFTFVLIYRNQKRRNNV